MLRGVGRTRTSAVLALIAGRVPSHGGVGRLLLLLLLRVAVTVTMGDTAIGHRGRVR